MHEKAVPAKASKTTIESKTRPAGVTKKVVVYPPAKREISADPYFSTDRYRLCSPLFPDSGSIQVSEPR